MPFRENTPCENKLRINLSGGISCHLKKFRRTGFYPIRKTISSCHLAAISQASQARKSQLNDSQKKCLKNQTYDAKKSYAQKSHKQAPSGEFTLTPPPILKGRERIRSMEENSRKKGEKGFCGKIASLRQKAKKNGRKFWTIRGGANNSTSWKNTAPQAPSYLNYATHLRIL